MIVDSERRKLKRSLLVIVAIAIFSSGAQVAAAHQPVILSNQDVSAGKGPLLVDGTVSFAVRASFTKAGETRGFRAQFKAGDLLSVQLLILDKSPDNKLKATQLPTLTITSPSGSKQALKLNERTKFFEPYSQTRYLYLGRLTRTAEAGIYSFSLTARAKSAVTIGVGDREVPGEVSRGVTPTASASATPLPSTSPTSAVTPTASPSSTKSAQVGFTLAQVQINNTDAKCWSIINKNVYDLTRWINSHPGGQSAIQFICGTDGTNAFLAQHRGQSSPFSRLASFYIGPLVN